MPVAPAIQTHDLRKMFGGQVAVKGLTLRVQQGEVFGFLGPNGAGKTTSIKMLLGLIAPTSGAATLLGAPMGDRRTLAKVGFLPEHFRFQDWLTATDFLDLHARLYGMDSRHRKSRVDELLEAVGLSDFRDSFLRTFSKGMLQRIGLAQALLNRPRLVFLDEPTSGLDPVGRRLVRDMIHDLRRQGTTVFLNSHLLSEIEVTCDRVAFISHGQVIRSLELDTLTETHIRVTIRAQGLDSAMATGLSQWGRDIDLDGDQISLTLFAESSIPEINRFLVAHGADVFAITPHRPSLEEIFIQTVGQDGGL